MKRREKMKTKTRIFAMLLTVLMVAGLSLALLSGGCAGHCRINRSGTVRGKNA